MNRNQMEKKSRKIKKLTLQGRFLIKSHKIAQKCFFSLASRYSIIKCWKVLYFDGYLITQTSFLITSYKCYAKYWLNTSSISAKYFTLKIMKFFKDPVTDYIAWKDLLRFGLISNIILQWSLPVWIQFNQIIYP